MDFWVNKSLSMMWGSQHLRMVWGRVAPVRTLNDHLMSALGDQCFFLFFFTRSGRPALASVPDTINCRILTFSEYVHVYIISSRCDTTPGANSCNQHITLNGDITQGGHPSKYWLSQCCCTSVLEIEGTGVSTSLGRAVAFGIWSASYGQTT
jgi:hypothetical protein